MPPLSGMAPRYPAEVRQHACFGQKESQGRGLASGLQRTTEYRSQVTVCALLLPGRFAQLPPELPPDTACFCSGQGTHHRMGKPDRRPQGQQGRAARSEGADPTGKFQEIFQFAGSALGGGAGPAPQRPSGARLRLVSVIFTLAGRRGPRGRQAHRKPG